MKLPKWWGDLCPGELEFVYKGRRRKPSEAKEDRRRLRSRTLEWRGRRWVTNGHLMLRFDEAAKDDEVVPFLVSALEERFREAEAVADPSVPEKDRRNALATFPSKAGLVLARLDYVALVERLFPRGEWRVAGPMLPISRTSGYELVAVLMPVRP